jgi:hypothetical protein
MELKKDDNEDLIKFILSDLKPSYSSYSQCDKSINSLIISSFMKRIKKNVFNKKKIIDEFSIFKNNKKFNLFNKNQFFNISLFFNNNKKFKEEIKKKIDFKINKKIKKNQTLDLTAPGKYFPNYNYIFKRSPSYSIGNPYKNNINNNFISVKNLFLNNKNKKNNCFTSRNNLKKINYSLEDISKYNDLLKNKPIQIINQNDSLKNKNDETNKKENNIILKNNSCNHNKINLLKKISKNLEINKEKNNNLNFKKMLGRNDKRFKKENDFIPDFYDPLYEQTLPHIKSVIFNPLENKEKLKRLLNKQILFQYNPSYDEYFVFRLQNYYGNEN